MKFIYDLKSRSKFLTITHVTVILQPPSPVLWLPCFNRYTVPGHAMNDATRLEKSSCLHHNLKDIKKRDIRDVSKHFLIQKSGPRFLHQQSMEFSTVRRETSLHGLVCGTPKYS
uniref:Uncharacterized protein n=1 Tax=Salix viminalis TaxID=40686 RepID=A0A6N2LEG6_SALVM